MGIGETAVEVSIIIPARDEEACLADCLKTLVDQQDCPSHEIIVVDDQSRDRTRTIAGAFPVKVISADPLPAGWTGKCNAAWSGARVAKGKWLLFTDADTRHAPNSIAVALQEAHDCDAALLSYSPRQEVRGFAERALMPVIFAELATTYRPKEVCDPNSPVAAANGQFLLIRRDVYDRVGGHASLAGAIVEDVELAKRVKQAGYKLRFRVSDTVSTRMYRSFPQLLEGWSKNLALLFAQPRSLAFWRLVEFGVILSCAAIAMQKWIDGDTPGATIALGLVALFLASLWRRVRRAHFDWLSMGLAFFGLPLFAALLLHSERCHRKGLVRWKGRQYPGARRHSEVPGKNAQDASEAATGREV